MTPAAGRGERPRAHRAVGARQRSARTPTADRATAGRRQPPPVAGRRPAPAGRSGTRATMACGPGAAPRSGSARSSATSSADRCGAGRSARTSGPTGSHRSIRPAKAIPASVPAGRAASTSRPAARAISRPASHSAVFPIPAAPVNSTAPTRRSAATKPRSEVSSESRPMTSGVGSTRSFIRLPWHAVAARCSDRSPHVPAQILRAAPDGGRGCTSRLETASKQLQGAKGTSRNRIPYGRQPWPAHTPRGLSNAVPSHLVMIPRRGWIPGPTARYAESERRGPVDRVRSVVAGGSQDLGVITELARHCRQEG